MTSTPPSTPSDYDPSRFPAFAVTVDIVILTMSSGALHVLLVRRGEAPFRGRWAVPGGFKRPSETLDEAARRELTEETGVDAASVLRQFGAYGDPGRDPRMNVVTVAYVAVLRDVGAIVAGSDAADASLIPVSAIRDGAVDLAFDHLRIVGDAIERVRLELETTGIAAAFVGPTFTLAELRAVYEAVWGVQLDAANFRRSIVGRDEWVIPTGNRARPGTAGGRPAELYRAGRAWARGGPIHRTSNDRK
jgi:8-oxo-dGTP diphosphatase